MKTNKFITTTFAAVVLIGTLFQARADDTKLDPTGTYIWTMQGRNGGPDRTNTLVLKLDGGNLTGHLISPRRGGETRTQDITDGVVTSTNFTFTVVRTFNDNSFTNKFSGTLVDGSIKGKIEFTTRDGDTRSRDWEAKLQK